MSTVIEEGLGKVLKRRPFKCSSVRPLVYDMETTPNERVVNRLAHRDFITACLTFYFIQFVFIPIGKILMKFLTFIRSNKNNVFSICGSVKIMDTT